MLNVRRRRNAIALLAAVVFLAVGGVLSAQQLTGTIFGHVEDEQQGRLPGVTVSLTGPTRASAQTTDARGEYRFLNLSPGNYALTYDMQGFSKVTKPNVQVAVGQNTQTTATLSLSTVEAAVTVRGETALLETRKVSTGATVTQVEMQSIPTARDPWVVLASVPGVLVDRVNVGGNESGQQSNFVGKGSSRDSAVWNVDGVTITDMGAIGASPAYYDFDSFEEMQISTGGTDLTAATAGVQLNMVTKRGTNDVHGSARTYLADDDWESRNLPDEAKAQGRIGGGNSIDEVIDYGVEVGGPIVRDRVWLWGSYGRNQIDLRTITNTTDKTTLEGINGKLNVQALDSTALTGFYSKDDKIKLGRNAGTTRPPETAWNQDGPTTIYKGEISQVFTSKLFATASYAYVDGGFQLIPASFDADPTGPNIDAYRDEGGVWHNSYLWYITKRPQHQAAANGSFFFNTGNLGHELKFGFGYRTTPVTSTTQWSGSGNFGLLDLGLAFMTRTATYGSKQEYYSGYLGDTLTAGNFTINGGVRYDLQRGNPAKATVAPNSVIPDILPGFSVAEAGQAFEWEDISPRVGVTYALGAQKKVLLKASYARFADQMGAGLIYHQNAIPGYSYLAYYWNDANGNNRVERDELDFGSGIQGAYNVDPNDPTSADVFNVTDPDFEAGTTDEVIIGADLELIPDLVVGAAYTYRTYEGQSFTYPTGLTRSDFELGSQTVTGIRTDFGSPTTSITIPVWRLRADQTVPPGDTLTNRPDYEQIYHGGELTLNKRLSNGWMARASVSYADISQEPGSGACVNPLNILSTTNGAACPDSGEIVAVRSAGSGSKSGIFIHSTWGFNISGLYQLPLGFNIAGSFFGREGFPYPKWVAINPDAGGSGAAFGTRNVLVGKLDDERHPNVYNLDLRLEKIIDVKPLQIGLAMDVFNVLNENTVIQRNGRLNQGTFNRIDEVQAPRVVRLGARLSF
ncbi:MAG: carboxypeptidase regulatory-like domain-containing protein [Thermoanaerobaculia bacterium]